MKKYKCILPSRDNNRLFRELSGYIYIADHSGDTPEDTDDGPLLFAYQNCKELAATCTYEGFVEGRLASALSSQQTIGTRPSCCAKTARKHRIVLLPIPGHVLCCCE